MLPHGVTRNVVVLGLVSFFTDVASEMLYPVIPLFFMSLPGASAALLGWMEGLAEGLGSGLRYLGGAWSDCTGRRKPFVLVGYCVSALSKPVMGLSAVVAGWPLFLSGRISDRFGKSIRTAARDALIADSTEPACRGLAFGFHRAMDTAGAVFGPLITLALILWLAGPEAVFKGPHSSGARAMKEHFLPAEELPLKWLFFIAVLPGLCSVLLTIFGVREAGQAAACNPSSARPSLFQRYPRSFWILLLANAVFSLGNSSDSFLILRCGETGLSFGLIMLAFALFNAVYALAATHLGRLSDRIGRKPVVICGWATYALVYLGFSLTSSPWASFALFALYGLYQALTEGVTKAMVSDHVPSNQRAGAIGLLYAVSGLGQLLASALAGLLWKMRLFDGWMVVALAIGALLALLAIPLIWCVPAAEHARPISGS